MLNHGKQGWPAGTSVRLVDASAPGGLSCRAYQAAKAGRRKPNSDVLGPLGSCMERDCTTACKLSQGPCAPLAAAQALPYVSQERICKRSNLCSSCSAVHTQHSQARTVGAKLLSVSICQSWCPWPFCGIYLLCCPGHLALLLGLLPDVPPALQILPDHLHGDALLKANLVLALAGIRLHSDILLLCGWQANKKVQLFEVGMQVLLSVSSSSPDLALLSWLPRCTGSASGFSREGKGPDFTAAPSVCQSQPGPQMAWQSPGQHRGSPRLPVLRER